MGKNNKKPQRTPINLLGTKADMHVSTKNRGGIIHITFEPPFGKLMTQSKPRNTLQHVINTCVTAAVKFVGDQDLLSTKEPLSGEYTGVATVKVFIKKDSQ